MIRIEVESGQKRGTKVESSSNVLRIGRADGNDSSPPDDHVSGDHARVQITGERWMLQDLKSTNGTAIVRGQERRPLEADAPTPLENGDVIELGHGDKGVRLVVTLVPKNEEAEEEDDRKAQVLAVRSIDDLVPATSKVEQETTRLRALYEAQKSIGTADDLRDVARRDRDAVRHRPARHPRDDRPA